MEDNMIIEHLSEEIAKYRDSYNDMREEIGISRKRDKENVR